LLHVAFRVNVRLLFDSPCRELYRNYRELVKEFLSMAKKFNPPIRELVRNLRGKQGWTQRELGRRLGVSDRAISTYEDGSRQPSPNRLQRLLDLAQDPDAPIPPSAESAVESLRNEMNARFNSIERQLAEVRGMLLAFGSRAGEDRSQ